jgi:hypothetical protein
MSYQNITGAGIGTLLRMIAEEKSQSPMVSPRADTGSPQRELTQTPVYGPESPGSERVTSLQPEDVTAPAPTVPVGVSRVGPLAIGGTDINPTPEVPQEPKLSIPSKTDINPETGKAFAVNPSSGVWDDNYWANTVEPRLLSGWVPGQPQEQAGPTKSDINPETGKPFGINPETGVWDDNYWAQFAEPAIKAGTFFKKEEQPKPQAEVQQPTLPLATQITTNPEANFRWISPEFKSEGQILGESTGAVDVMSPAFKAQAEAAANAEMLKSNSAENLSPQDLKKITEELKKKYFTKPTPTPTPIPTRIR